MPKEAFETKRFRADTLDIINQANGIIASYTDAGFTLTLRQLYYQFVARDLLPNKQSEYKRLGNILNDARMAGLVDWSAIEDRTRFVRKPATWESPEAIIDAVADQYKEDLWKSQRYRPEVWIEKDALIGVLEPAGERWRVPYFSCRGNASASEMYAAGKRFARVRRDGQIPIVFHLGDHDPSGIDMTRDNRERLATLARFDVEVRRLALNMDQIEEYNPPPNPAKESDSRFDAYVAEYGTESSWELDALAPDVIDGLINDAMAEIVAARQWREAERDEAERKAQLAKIASNWDDVARYVEDL